MPRSGLAWGHTGKRLSQAIKVRELFLSYLWWFWWISPDIPDKYNLTKQISRWFTYKNSSWARKHRIKEITKMKVQTKDRIPGIPERKYKYNFFSTGSCTTCDMLLAWMFTGKQWKPQIPLLICTVLTETMSLSHSTNVAWQ